MDPPGPPGQSWVVVKGVCGAGARASHDLIPRPEHPLGGGATMRGRGGICRDTKDEGMKHPVCVKRCTFTSFQMHTATIIHTHTRMAHTKV